MYIKLVSHFLYVSELTYIGQTRLYFRVCGQKNKWKIYNPFFFFPKLLVDFLLLCFASLVQCLHSL